MKRYLPLRPPVYNSLEEDYKATLVYTLSWAWIIGVTAIISTMIIILPAFTVRGVCVIVSVDICAFVCLFLNRQKQIRLASIILPHMLWVIATLLALTAGGIYAPAVVAYLPVIITSGFLLGGTAGIMMALLCLLSSFSFVLLGNRGILPEVQVVHTPVTLWLSYSISGVVIAVMQYFVTKYILFSFQTIAKETDERKLAEREIRNMNEMLDKKVRERTRELEIVNRDLYHFNSMLSHDLRGALRRVKSFSEIMSRKLVKANTDSDIMESLQMIKMDATKMDGIVTGLLEMSKLGSKPVQLKQIDLNKTVETVIADLKKHWAANKHEVSVSTMPVMNSDALLMQQIFTNLLSNAFKYSSKNEVIKIDITFTDNGNHYLFAITDNGVGFDMADHDKLFKGFVRLHSDADYEGTGIGLNSVKRFVEKLGGRIWAESSPPAGSTFYFEVPLQEMPTQE